MARKKDRGWIKLYRNIQYSEIWDTEEKFNRRDAWIDLLLMANHEERQVVMPNGEAVTVQAGQVLTSLNSLEVRWRWSRNRVLRYFSLLTELGMITKTKLPHGTLLTLIKYEFYQGGETGRGTSNGTPDGTPDETGRGTQTRIIRTNRRMKEESASAQNDPEYEEDYYQ